MQLDNIQVEIQEIGGKFTAVIVTEYGEICTSNAFQTKADCMSAVTVIDKVISSLKASKKKTAQAEKQLQRNCAKLQQMLPTAKERLQQLKYPANYPIIEQPNYSHPSKIYPE